MKIFRFVCACAVISFVSAQDARDVFLEAVAAGDAPRVVRAMAEVEPDTKDDAGTPALVLAAKSGDFETVKVLLWRGADPAAKDAAGHDAVSSLDPAAPGYAPLNLLLRCYGFAREHGDVKGKARVPHLTIVSDNYVDHSHPGIEPHYLVNEAEKSGEEGVDDDGNGFVDDIYGWNFDEDRPSRFPQLAIGDGREDRRYLTHLMNRFLAVANGHARPEQDRQIQRELRMSYGNPLVKQIGYQNLMSANLDLHDFSYASMLYESSHGTHVAGIVINESEKKAVVHGCSFGVFDPSTVGNVLNYDGLTQIAQNSNNYSDYITAVLAAFREESVARGRRASDYLGQTGAGVVNMSWEKGRGMFAQQAEQCIELYREYGKNPGTIGQVDAESGLDLVADPGLEFKIANAAAFALLFYENPDVLFCISAGNDGENNDLTLPSPVYLARFFPNVIAVASHGDSGAVSDFSCYGLRSVSLAAHGEKVDSYLLAGLNGEMSGTSMATPRVAGVAAGLRKDYPEYSAAEISRILLATVDQKDHFADIVLSGGMMNKQAAREMAASWDRDNFALLAAETERVRRDAGQDGPVIGGQHTTEEGEQGIDRMITSLSGYNGEWDLVLSAGTPFTNQVITGSGEFPLQWVEEHWQQGLIVTQVSGDDNGWAVVMSGGVKRSQQLLGFEFDQAKIAELSERGYRVTAAGGWNDQWVLVLDEGTSLGHQRYTLPSPLHEKRIEWIKQRWQEGYRITTVAGDDSPEVGDDGWFFVMSQDSGLGEQVVSDIGAWPRDWIAEKRDAGYEITSVAGGGERYMVVMSQGTSLSSQLASPEATTDLNVWLDENW